VTGRAVEHRAANAFGNNACTRDIRLRQYDREFITPIASGEITGSPDTRFNHLCQGL
jgi:hypothetical protein